MEYKHHNKHHKNSNNLCLLDPCKLLSLPKIVIPTCVEDKLVWQDTSIFSAQGYSVDISQDGNVIVVGAPGDNNNDGGVYIYRFVSGVWTREKRIIENATPMDIAAIGRIVAISGDGNVIAFGGMFDDSVPPGFDAGIVYIYRYNGIDWIKEASLKETNTLMYGRWLDLSYDGTTLSVLSYNTPTGESIYMYRYATSTWTLQQTVSKTTNYGFNNVSLSADGNVMVVGSDGDFTLPNTQYSIVYRFNGTVWVAEKVLISNLNTGGNDTVTSEVSKDGTTIAVGVYRSDSSVGRILLYSYNSTISDWVKRTEELFVSGTQNNGYSLDFSPDSKSLVSGAYRDNNLTGAVYLWQQNTDGTWNTSYVKKLVGDNSIGQSLQGISVSISDNNIVSGGSNDNDGTGAVWTFCM